MAEHAPVKPLHPVSQNQLSKYAAVNESHEPEVYWQNQGLIKRCPVKEHRGSEAKKTKNMLAPNSRTNLNFSNSAADWDGQTLPSQTVADNAPVSTHSPDCTITFDLTGRILTWNAAAEQLLGYSAGEMVGQNISRLAVAGRGESLKRRKDGAEIGVQAKLAPVLDAEGGVCGTSATYTATSQKAGHPKVMLATAGAGGTVATVRLLKKRGFDVSVVSSERLGTAAWSNCATDAYQGPPESDGEGFLKWLMETGKANPGHVLLPTSDQTSWLYTVNAAELNQYYRTYQPPVATMSRILDKNLFGEAVIRAGLSILPNWEPKNMEELTAIAPTLPYPILIKPRTHVHRLRNDKGLVVHTKAEMIEKYAQYCDVESLRAADNPLLPDAGLPILQQFVDVSKEGVYSISGFIDRTGELFVSRRSVKVFQRSQPVGVGICFESRPAAPALSNGVRRLCRELGYFGLFEVEFIRFGDTWAAIDFNPRLFNQIGLDIRRGMPLPYFACLDALGEHEALRQAIAESEKFDQDAEAVFCDRFTFRSILVAKVLTGRISRTDLSYWRNWMKRHSTHAADFAMDADDQMPGLIHALSEIYLGLKAFPKFLRLTPKTSPELREPALSKVRS